MRRALMWSLTAKHQNPSGSPSFHVPAVFWGCTRVLFAAVEKNLKYLFVTLVFKMSNTRHQKFRNFLTERFTNVAVEIFAEVEAIVEAYYEDNKRLRNILHMVLNPEIQLPRIGVSLLVNLHISTD